MSNNKQPGVSNKELGEMQARASGQVDVKTSRVCKNKGCSHWDVSTNFVHCKHCGGTTTKEARVNGFVLVTGHMNAIPNADTERRCLAPITPVKLHGFGLPNTILPVVLSNGLRIEIIPSPEPSIDRIRVSCGDQCIEADAGKGDTLLVFARAVADMAVKAERKRIMEELSALP